MADRPIFICGTERSGTTLLMRILTCSRNIVFPKYETWFFSNIYNRTHLLETLNEEDRFKLLINSFSKISHGFYRQFIKNAQIFKQLKESDRKAETIFDILQTKIANLQNRNRWGDKSPGNEYHAEKILQAYPSAKLVYVLRDFHDVASSRKFKRTIKDKETKSGDAIRGAMMWKKSVQQHLYNVNCLPYSQYYTLKFEDLTQHPEKTLSALGDFLEEPLIECLTQTEKGWYFQPTKQLNADLSPAMASNSSYQDKQYGNRLSSSAIGIYKKKLSKLEIMLINVLCFSEARLTGYMGNRNDLIGSIAWRKIFIRKSKHLQGQPYCRIEVKK